jgi:hypothetical protein
MEKGLLKSVVWRNVLGAIALLIAYYVPDRISLDDRVGANKFLPYLFLLLMYGWVVFHNRILFEGLYLNNRTRTYFLRTLGGMVISSTIMHIVLVYRFNQSETLSKILTFWVFTITGLGIYVMFKFLHLIQNKSKNPAVRPAETTEFFIFFAEGSEKQLLLSDILYLESLENYVKVFTKQKSYIVRQSLKEAEQKLPKYFLRISRSHIVNTRFIESAKAESLTINGALFKIGKVYKRYVEEQLNQNI